jgi:hypothetical protein
VCVCERVCARVRASDCVFIPVNFSVCICVIVAIVVREFACVCMYVHRSSCVYVRARVC